jgi:dihydrofolate synthase/folylpolyglutamate synthase
VLALLSKHVCYGNKRTIENIETFQTVASAYQRALADYQTGELILVFGSFVTVADVLAEQS